MIELFEEQLDQIYWSGFSQQLKQDEPDRYLWELAEFVKIYNA